MNRVRYPKRFNYDLDDFDFCGIALGPRRH